MDLERYNESDSLVQIKVEHKRRDDFSEDNKYYPLFSNINDKIGVIAEHAELNKNEKWLQFALFKSKDKYYFFDVRKNTTEIKQYVDDYRFICPYCGGNLYMVTSHYRKGCSEKIPTHLRHNKSGDKTIKECIFNTGNNNYKDLRNAFFSKESFKHRRLKLKLYKLAQKGKLELLIPDSHNIVSDLDTYEAKADFKLRQVKVVDALIETRVLKKDEITNGYQPDLVLISNEGEHIYCEVTVNSGKTVEKYYPIWDRLKNTVIEIKYSENKEMTSILNMIDAVKQMNFIEEDDDTELFIFNDVTMRFLYSPIIDAARKEHHKAKIELSDLKKKEYERLAAERLLKLHQKEVRKDFWIKLLILVDWYYSKTNFKVLYNKYTKTWTNEDGEELWTKWNHINYNGTTLNFKLPDIVWKMLSTNGIKYKKGFYNISD